MVAHPHHPTLTVALRAHPQGLVLVPEVPQDREETTAHHLRTRTAEATLAQALRAQGQALAKVVPQEEPVTMALRTLGLTRVPTLAHQVLDKVLGREDLVTMVPRVPTQALDLEHKVPDKVLVLDKEEPATMVLPSQLRTLDQEQDPMPVPELEHRAMDLEPEMLAAEQALQPTAVRELAQMPDQGRELARMPDPDQEQELSRMQAETQLGTEMRAADQELALMQVHKVLQTQTQMPMPTTVVLRAILRELLAMSPSTTS